jgi:hypothetical protein
MHRGVARMNQWIKDDTSMGKVISGWHDDGEMAVSTTATSGVNGTGIGIELSLKNL